MNKKAAIQLSINFLVIIIISILVLGMGFVLINKTLNNGDISVEQLNSKLENQIELLLTDNSLPVAIPIVEREIGKGDITQFGIGVVNLDKSKTTDFYLHVDYDEAYDKNKNPIEDMQDYIDIIDGFDLESYGKQTINFQENYKYNVPIAVSDEAPYGTYVFNVCICQETNICTTCIPDDAEDYYSNQIYKLYVKVS